MICEAVVTDCQCQAPGRCSVSGRNVNKAMHERCKTDQKFRLVLTGCWNKVDPIVKENIEPKEEVKRIELPCIHRAEKPIEYASCGCHVYDCEIHERCVPWYKKKLKDTIKVCESCPDRIAATPSKISAQEIQSLLGLPDLMSVCITLQRRPNRWQWFNTNTLITGVERFVAVDGKHPPIPVPEWWKAGRGAWGCHLSHQAILKKAIEQNKSYLVFEDDALFDSAFVDKVKTFLVNVPKDWDMIYFGGQHLGVKRPIPVSKEVQRGMRINRTHAFMVRNTFLERLSSHLNWMTNEKRKPHHVDWRIQMLHPKYKVYSPTKWLVGQRGGVSDIGKSFAENRFWR